MDVIYGETRQITIPEQPNNFKITVDYIKPTVSGLVAQVIVNNPLIYGDIRFDLLLYDSEEALLNDDAKWLFTNDTMSLINDKDQDYYYKIELYPGTLNENKEYFYKLVDKFDKSKVLNRLQ